MSIITTWGSTPRERAEAFTCDAHLRGANAAFWRAIDIGAPPGLVFAWLCQMRVAPYSYDRLDNGGRQSPQERTVSPEALEPGDRMMGIFELVDVQVGRELTLLSTKALVQEVTGGSGRGFIPSALTYRVSAQPDRPGVSRVVVKFVGAYPDGISGALERVLLPLADLVMMRRQLKNFKALAERDVSTTEIKTFQGVKA